MNLVFVFMLASGAIFHQAQSAQNCQKLAAAFANGEKIMASINGEDVPILQGVCIEIEDEAAIEVLQTIAAESVSVS
jgi:phosphoribosylpyrophosphate synthetase